MPSRSGEQLSKPMDENQFTGISFAVDSEIANEASLSCFLCAAAWKACSLSVHAPYGIALHFVQLGREESCQMPRDVAKKLELNNVANSRGYLN